MDEEYFNRLLSLLRPRIAVDGVMSSRRTGVAPISEEVALYCMLRYLAGGLYVDIRDVAQISAPSFYRCLNKGIAAILSCSELKIAIPTTATEIDQAADNFKAMSTEGGLDGCVDGMLVKIITPSPKDAGGNVRAYFSGHYYHMGFNVQAVCDHLCRFIVDGSLLTTRTSASLLDLRGGEELCVSEKNTFQLRKFLKQNSYSRVHRARKITTYVQPLQPHAGFI
jgi:hypothetical protein